MDFRNKLILAPMEGVTSLPYRALCKKYGADIVISEMINAKSIIYAAKKLSDKLAVSEEERPVGIQLAASNAEDASKAAELIQGKADFIDINMGCPSTNIISIGCGAALLSKPEKIADITRAVVKASNAPVTVKIRADNAARNAKIIEDNGAEAITIHARTIAQKGSGKINYQILEDVKNAVNIPVIGNGGIKSAEDARKIFQICDSAMIGTAALGNPSIFDEIKSGLKNKKFKTINRTEQFLELTKISEKYNHNNFKWLKQISPYFIHGTNNASQLRLRISKTRDLKQLLEIFKTNS